MIFQYTLPQLLNRSKTQTRRIMKANETAVYDDERKITAVLYNQRTKWHVGMTYAVQPGRTEAAVARIRLLEIRSEIVTGISEVDALAEGYANRETFLASWRKIHGDKRLDAQVWALTFEVVEADEA